MIKSAAGGLLLLAVIAVAPVASVASASPSTTPTCNDSWMGGSGDWNTAADWSAGVPNGASDVCITASGTYTVTLDGPGTVNSLTLGGSSGKQTLLAISGDNLEATFYFNLDSTITPSGVFTLESDDTGNDPFPATINGEQAATLSNDGAFGTTGPYQDVINANVTNDSDGDMTLDGASTQSSEYDIVNNGKLSVSSGATFAMDETAFTQTAGSIDNKGTVSDTGPGSEYDQTGGTETGNPIDLTGSVDFKDSGGKGSFTLTGLNSIGGTIPSGQTVTSASSASAETQTEIVSPGLTNKGRLVITTTGTTTEPAELISSGGSLTNDATIALTGTSPQTDYLGATFTNAKSGTIDVASPGAYLGNATDTNSGTLLIAKGDSLSLNGATLDDTSTAATDITVSTTAALTSILNGTLHLAGKLGVTTIGKPSNGKAFVPVTAGTLTGKFGSISSGSQAYTASYASTAVSLKAAFSAAAKNFTAKSKQTSNVTVATVAGAAKGTKATINWGDGKTSSGTVTVSGGKGTVKGSHEYKKAGSDTVTVVITAGGATATVTGKATVKS